MKPDIHSYIRPGAHAHLVGIGGVSMSPLAEVLHGAGVVISGSDLHESAAVDHLRALGIPVVIALNMSDLLAKKGDRIDTERLSALFGCQVVETSALKGTGLKEVTDQAVAAAREQKWKAPGRVFPARVESAILKAEEALGDRVEPSLRRWYAIKLLERDPKVLSLIHI